jgi:DNA-binding LacI/PurR family transcriptional regulator
MKFEALTIKDIAKALGLSTSTVSRALRDSYEISAETKQLVLNYAQAHNYHPNPVALGLKERRTKSIGVVVCEIDNSFFSQAINGIESVANAEGYHTIIAQTMESVEQEMLNVQFLASRSVDGLIMSVSASGKDFGYLQELSAKGLPIVFFDRVVEAMDTFKIKADNYTGAYEAAVQLLKTGYKKIAFLGGASGLSVSGERFSGYRSALADFDGKFDEALVQYCEFGGRELEFVTRFFDQAKINGHLPDAVFAGSDRLTVACLRVLRILRPELKHICITGFSNADLIDFAHPPIATIRQPAFDMGVAAMKSLIELMQTGFNQLAVETITLPTSLILR